MKNDSFLKSIKNIDEYQSEYKILSSIYDLCSNRVFLLEFFDMRVISGFLPEIVKHVCDKYKSYEVSSFSVSQDGQSLLFNDTMVLNQSGFSIQDEALFNRGQESSKQNSSFVLVRSANSFVLYHYGVFDLKFKASYADRNKLIKAENKKIDINHLEQAFDQYHVYRKHNDCPFIVNGRVSNMITEQGLRNHLIEYLRRETNLYVMAELCTSLIEDEESVDISLIDSNRLVSIVEVKFFVQKGLYEDSEKSQYSFYRFRDGYEQLNKYCAGLNHDSHRLHSAYLYMFYASKNNEEYVLQKAQKYYDSFVETGSANTFFLNNYKDTIVDNLLDIKKGRTIS